MMTQSLEDDPFPRHRPVMVEEVLHFLSPSPEDLVVDLTIGEGGHAQAILPSLEPSGIYLGIDRDPDALQKASLLLYLWRSRGILYLSQGTFAPLGRHLDLVQGKKPRKILADLGISSLQLDLAQRGFSFHYPDAPLDLRMNQEEGVPAWEWLRGVEIQRLTLLLKELGGLQDPRAVAHRLKHSLPRTMGELKEIVAPLRFREPRKNLENRILHTLRIVINQELELLYALLIELPFVVARGARVVFLTYHSAEDHLVKWAFRAYAKGTFPPLPRLFKMFDGTAPGADPLSWYQFYITKQKGERFLFSQEEGLFRGRILTPKPVLAQTAELSQNPRSHSAHLRAFEFS